MNIFSRRRFLSLNARTVLAGTVFGAMPRFGRSEAALAAGTADDYAALFNGRDLAG